jgi:hypothetical protein
MEPMFVLAVIVAVPVVLLPAAFMWYLNVSGLAAALRQKRTARTESTEHK